MNYQQKKHNKKTIFSFLAIFGAIILINLTNPLIKESIAQTTLADCSTLSETAIPGQNCLFYGLPLCKGITGIDYVIETKNIFNGTPKPRVNCANLSDLPLCSQTNGTKNPGKNCVNECSLITSGDGKRGVDFAVHDRNCVRFCDKPEDDFTIAIDPGNNCVERKCHQFLKSDFTENPASINSGLGKNCNILDCNILSVSELELVSKTNLNKTPKKYCDGSNIKCYEFSQAQLQHVQYRGDGAPETMCQIHNCRTESESCVNYANDDVQKIKNKGTDFEADYVKYINFGAPVNNKESSHNVQICKQTFCKPKIARYFSCTPLESDSAPTTKHPECSSDCQDGYCTKIIDCNEAENTDAEDCQFEIPNNSLESVTKEDTTNSWFYRPTPRSETTESGVVVDEAKEDDNGNICYNIDELESRGYTSEIKIPLIGSLGRFHDYLTKKTRSPGLCTDKRHGSRGLGYIYLCGVNGSLYNEPHSDAAYIKGYPKTTYDGKNATHTLTVCVRYNNAMILQRTCGERECGITCSFGKCYGNVCGVDKCYDLKIKDSDSKECANENGMFDSANSDRGCASTIDSYVRVRAVKYDNRICAFLDLKGTLAYDEDYMDGSEKLSDGTCLSGYRNADNQCEGAKNTNDSKGLAHKWRTLFRINYIGNNQPDGKANGYLDGSGTLHPEQECPKVALKIFPKKTYNLSNRLNSPNLFRPPLYISEARRIKGGPASIPEQAGSFGKTDFHFPEIKVAFGLGEKLLSLDVNKTGEEDALNNPNGNAILETEYFGQQFNVEVLVKKGLDEATNTPNFCLYQKIKDENGSYINPKLIDCVERQKPRIFNNLVPNNTSETFDTRKILTQYNPKAETDSKGNYIGSLAFNYVANFGANRVFDNCLSNKDDVCSSKIIFKDVKATMAKCDSSLEKYKLCAKRDECSYLEQECLRNEVEILNSTENTTSLLQIKNNCNDILLPTCNAKKGVSDNENLNVINYTTAPSIKNQNSYGWFNEICIISGFEHEKKRVIAHKLPNLLTGKCLIDSTSPYLTDGNKDTNCDDGGKFPNCICQEYAATSNILSDEYEVRFETNREAGLCEDMPLMPRCSPTIYTPNDASLSDPFYLSHSLNKTTYNNASGVHLSHKYRSEGKPSPDPIKLKGHAEFPMVPANTKNVIGSCNGFWKKQTSILGTSLNPTLNCEQDGEWSANVANPCERFSCDSITTTGLVSKDDETYTNRYSITETGEDRGKSHGFAIWPSFTKTNDFAELVSATNCIVGYEPAGSLPTRKCNQIGNWLTPENACQRIKCPKIELRDPISVTDSIWTEWKKVGGATFPEGKASRSSAFISEGSRVFGTCKESLGFFKIGNTPPTKECGHDGKWKTGVINVCTTKCDNISPTEGADLSHGFASWDKVSESEIATANGCSAGKVPYPYPPLKQIDGSPLEIIYTELGTRDEKNLNWQEFANKSIYSGAKAHIEYFKKDKQLTTHGNKENYLETYLDHNFTGTYKSDEDLADLSKNQIPGNIADDLRTPSKPKRFCQPNTVKIKEGENISISVWSGTNSNCIDSCPGAEEDPRIGVGRTIHNASTGKVVINWVSGIKLGKSHYVTNCGSDSDPLSAKHFDKDNGSNCFLLKRECGMDGKWLEPEILCAATNNGQIGNATYSVSPSSSTPVNGTDYGNSAVVGSNTIANGTCISEYWTANRGEAETPKRQCVHDSASSNPSQIEIDKVYWKLNTSSKDCIKVTCLPTDDFSNDPENRVKIFAPEEKDYGYEQNIECVNGPQDIKDQVFVLHKYTTLPSGAEKPFIKCLLTGEWSEANYAKNCKRGCFVPSANHSSRMPQSKWQQYIPDDGKYASYVGYYNRNARNRQYHNFFEGLLDEGDHIGGAVKWDTFTLKNDGQWDAFTLKHGQWFQTILSASDWFGLGCSQLYYGGSCEDGVFVDRSLTVNSWDRVYESFENAKSHATHDGYLNVIATLTTPWQWDATHNTWGGRNDGDAGNANKHCVHKPYNRVERKFAIASGSYKNSEVTSFRKSFPNESSSSSLKAGPLKSNETDGTNLERRRRTLTIPEIHKNLVDAYGNEFELGTKFKSNSSWAGNEIPLYIMYDRHSGYKDEPEINY